MTDWKRIHNFKDYDLDVDVSIGMWPSDKYVYFTVEPLDPEDYLTDQSIEFKLSIDRLGLILNEAERISLQRKPYKWEARKYSAIR